MEYVELEFRYIEIKMFIYINISLQQKDLYANYQRNLYGKGTALYEYRAPLLIRLR